MSNSLSDTYFTLYIAFVTRSIKFDTFLLLRLDSRVPVYLGHLTRPLPLFMNDMSCLIKFSTISLSYITVRVRDPIRRKFYKRSLEVEETSRRGVTYLTECTLSFSRLCRYTLKVLIQSFLWRRRQTRECLVNETPFARRYNPPVSSS